MAVREIIHWIAGPFAFPPLGHPTDIGDWFFTVVVFIFWLAWVFFLGCLGWIIIKAIFYLLREIVTRPRYWYLTIKKAIQDSWDDVTRFVGTGVIGVVAIIAGLWLVAKLWPVLAWIFRVGLSVVVALVVLFFAIGLILLVAEKLGLSQFFRWTLWGTLCGIALYVVLFVGLILQKRHFPDEGLVTFLGLIFISLIFGLVVGLIASGIMRIVSVKIFPTTLGGGAIRAAVLGLAIGAFVLGSDYLSLQHQRQAQTEPPVFPFGSQAPSVLPFPTNLFSIPYPAETPTAPVATKIRGVGVTSGSTTARLDYRLDPNHSFDYQRLVHLTIMRHGKTVFDTKLKPDVNNETLGDELDKDTLQVVDLRGDGEPEVLVTIFTGGAHCCYVTTLYGHDLLGNRYTRVTQDWKDDMPKLKRLGHDAALSFVGVDPFSYKFASFADSGFPIRIWRYEPVKLTDVTRCYPDLVRADSKNWWAIARRRQGENGEATGFLAAYAADMYMLGEGEEALANIQRSRMLGVNQKYLSDLRTFLKEVGYENVSSSRADCR